MPAPFTSLVYTSVTFMRVSNAPARTRSLKIEKLVAELVGLPLMRENVFHAPQFNDGAIQKELCDAILVHRGEAILLSVKAQEKDRDEAATQRWLSKHSKAAVKQLRGACRSLRTRRVWCDHAILGRRDYERGEINVRHGVALVESNFETEVDLEGSELDPRPGLPAVALMSIADFLNVVHYLRTWRDLERYLTARFASLRGPDRRVVGAELALLGYYTAMRDSFDGCHGIADAKIVAAAGKHVREGAAFRDRERMLAIILEDFVAGLTHAHSLDLPAEAEGLRANMEESDHVKAIVRDEFCDLTIQERAALGEQLGYLCSRSAKGSKPVYSTVRIGRRPSTIYVFVVGWEEDPGELTLAACDIMVAACCYYTKPNGVLLLANQRGPDIRFSIGSITGVEPTLEMTAAGEEYFGASTPRHIGVHR